jgi:hypothetical protein
MAKHNWERLKLLLPWLLLFAVLSARYHTQCPAVSQPDYWRKYQLIDITLSSSDSSSSSKASDVLNANRSVGFDNHTGIADVSRTRQGEQSQALVCNDLLNQYVLT